MKILITGAEGFIGRNLIAALQTRGYYDLLKFDADTPLEQLEHHCAECEFVFHLAGVNRPKQQEEFMQGNFGFTDTLLRMLMKNKNRTVSRDRILNEIWGEDYFGDIRTVDVRIANLRKKLGLADEIRTVSKAGYRLEER